MDNFRKSRPIRNKSIFGLFSAQQAASTLFASRSDTKMLRQARKRLKNAVLREAVLAMMNQQPLTSKQTVYIKTLLMDPSRLFSTNLMRPVWDECWITLWLFRDIPLNTAEQERAATALIAIIEKCLPTSTYCLRRRIGNGLARTLMFLVGIFCYLLYHLDWLTGEGNWYNSVMLRILMITTSGVAPLFLPLFFIFDAMHANKVRAAAVTTLGNLQQSSSLSVIIRATRDSSWAVRVAALSALPIVLPELTPEHYGSFTSATVLGLCQVLDHAEDRLQLIILEALAKIGDGNCVRPVQRIAVKGQSEQVQSLAIHILPILQQRQQQEQSSKMLLRVSLPASDSSNALVRPAQLNADTAPQQLLRSSSFDTPSEDCMRQQ